MPSFHPKLMNFYPPFIGAGIRLKSINAQRNDIVVAMKLRWYNRNLWNVHFGGSLYSMCDPWFMFIVQHYLGSNYIVWDKAATIRFKKPGASQVRARFYLSENTLEIIKAQVDAGSTTDFNFSSEVFDKEGDVVAEINKTVYANSKQAHKEKQQARRRSQNKQTS